MKELFEVHKFGKDSQDLIVKVNNILAEYSSQGYRLSLRQLYYQLVSRDYIENTVKSYKRIGALVSDARLAGLVDWGMIEDRGREVVANYHFTSTAQAVRAVARSYYIDHWQDQPCYVEVMVEKDALSGILEPVCRELDVHFTANKGYSSSTALYEASKRIVAASAEGREVHLFYLGDHDPSGIDMTRDIVDRLATFTRDRISIETRRLALNWDQVQDWRPPENPAKETDSRYTAYVDKFGFSSWELDAVEPATLAGLVRDAVDVLIDHAALADVLELEENGTDRLNLVADNEEARED
jgi:hypothetical protein